MPNKNSNDTQKNVRTGENSCPPGRYTFASVQVDNEKPVRDNDRPVKPPKKGK